MTLAYITADKIGTPSGGGLVTHHEMNALAGLAEENGRVFLSLDRDRLAQEAASFSDRLVKDQSENWSRCLVDPWLWDVVAAGMFRFQKLLSYPTGLAHLYAGTFTDTVLYLKEQGYRISYTAAAHDINRSKEAHKELGLPFDYPHLTQPDLWPRYVGGYLAADVVICPSTYSKKIMEGYGCKRVEVITHGCDIPSKVHPLPRRFTVGYLGSYGADKGVVDFLRAWKRLNYQDAVLILAGRDSTTPWVRWLVETFGGGNVVFKGWIDDVADFYGQVSVYCQPSRSEGFGLEVLEAMAHGRPVICSDGAGAADIAVGATYEAGNVDDICEAIAGFRSGKLGGCTLEEYASVARDNATYYTWDIVRNRYQAVWRGMLP